MTEDDFKQFFTNNRVLLSTFARIAAGNCGLPPHYTDDVLQEGMIQTWKSWGTRLILIDDDERRRAWAYVCLQNVAKNMYRHEVKRRSARHENNDVSFYASEVLQISVERTALARETLDTVVKAIQGLPDRQRTALLLWKFGDISQIVIAETMGVTQGTVSKLLAKAHVTLRKLVGEETLYELELDDKGGGVA